MIRILIVDDHPIFRRGVASLIEGAGDMCVAAEVDDGLRAVRLAGQVPWDAALLDIPRDPSGGIQRRETVAGLRRDAHVLFGRDQAREAAPEDLVIVDDEHSYQVGTCAPASRHAEIRHEPRAWP